MLKSRALIRHGVLLVERPASLPFPLFLDQEAAKVGRGVADDEKDVIYRSIACEWNRRSTSTARGTFPRASLEHANQRRSDPIDRHERDA